MVGAGRAGGWGGRGCGWCRGEGGGSGGGCGEVGGSGGEFPNVHLCSGPLGNKRRRLHHVKRLIHTRRKRETRKQQHGGKRDRLSTCGEGGTYYRGVAHLHWKDGGPGGSYPCKGRCEGE